MSLRPRSVSLALLIQVSMTKQAKGELPHFTWPLLKLESAQSLLALVPTLLFLAPDLSSTFPLLSMLLDTPQGYSGKWLEKSISA